VTKTVYSSQDIIVEEQESSSPSTLEHETTCQIEFAPQYAEESESNNEEGQRERGTEEPLLIETRSDQPGQEEFGGDTIIVKPPAKLVKARKEKVSRQQTRRSERQQNLGQHYSAQPWHAMIAYTEEPHTLKEALISENSEKWYAAWESEVDSHVRNRTWKLAPLPVGREAIGCCWLFRQKDDGRFKARLVAKGYSQ